MRVTAGQRDDAVRVRGIGQCRQARGVDGAFRQDDGLPRVVPRVGVPASAGLLGRERARARPDDDGPFAGEFGEGARDGQRADVVVLDDPAGGGQPLTGAEARGLVPQPLLELIGAAIVIYEG
jgi:hypothetical protein